ncbi:MAG: glycoside hydrolase family 18 [Rikenellaceae bacterium]|nr:glycoside hydrolase family 18 [Rikenellaceae bacterium]
MKNQIKNRLLVAVLAVASALGFNSCSDWNEEESLDIKTPSLEDQNPKLYAQYLENLRRYKARPHKVVFASLDNYTTYASQKSQQLKSLPDSIDYISLMNPDARSPLLDKDIEEVRGKGTKVVYDIDFSVFDTDWALIVKEDEEGVLTEEDALEYIGQRTDDMLALCDRYGYDGVTFTYAGRSHVSLTEAEKAVYSGRQKAFFDRIAAWRASHPGKALSYIGNAQYLFDENKAILGECDYIILPSQMEKNGTDITIRAMLAVLSGDVPSDRFVAAVQTTRPDDADGIYGYFGTVDDSGNSLRSIIGGAQWAVEPSDFTRAGLYIYNAHYDYYDNDPVYHNIRRAVEIMNPSPNN